jgi:hypothetical protein
MLNINITLRDPSLKIARDFTISIDEQLPMRELLALLVNKLGWPEKDISGIAIPYAMRVERTTVLLAGDELIRTAGLLNGDIVTLGPVISANTGQHYQVSSSPGSKQQPQQPQPQPYTIAPLKRN